jgi:hypothetical protein
MMNSNGCNGTVCSLSEKLPVYFSGQTEEKSRKPPSQNQYFSITTPKHKSSNGLDSDGEDKHRQLSITWGALIVALPPLTTISCKEFVHACEQSLVCHYYMTAAC